MASVGSGGCPLLERQEADARISEARKTIALYEQRAASAEEAYSTEVKATALRLQTLQDAVAAATARAEAAKVAAMAA